MRTGKIIIAGILCIIYAYLGNKAFSIGNTQLPPIVKFMNPYFGFWANATPVQAEKKSIHLIEALENKGEIYFDDNLIPHIYGSTVQDVFRMQGYVHARNRLWQMDMMSRAAAGRLSEIVGKVALKHDKHQRKIGMLYAAENALRGVKMHDTTYAYLLAYCEGVNTYVHSLRSNEYPLMYKLMDFKPREWRPLDVMLIFKQMAYNLCFRHADVEATITRQFMGTATYDSLFSIMDYTYPVIPSQDEWKTFPEYPITDSVKIYIDSLPIQVFFKEEIDKDNGSNNWAINGKKSATGSPILANDPHLGLSLPSIWYENHLNCRGVVKLNAYGVSIPGVPGVIIGFNDNIAWGLTNVGHDVADWYALQWKGNDFSTYILDSTEQQPEKRIEKIAVKNGDTVNIKMYITEAGIVSYTEDRSDPRYGLAFHWIAHNIQKGDEFSTFFNLNTADNLEEYKQAIQYFSTPAQNMVFASTQGDIALTVQGKFKIKPVNGGRFVQGISSSEQIINQYIPKDQLPRQINPERNFVASANQVSTSKDYPYYYNSIQFEHSRNRYLNSFLDSSSNLSVEDFKEMQLSNYSTEAEYALEVMIPLVRTSSLDRGEKLLLGHLKKWNHRFDGSLKDPILYSIWMSQLMDYAWDEWESEKYEGVLQSPSIYNTLHLIDNGGEYSYMLNVLNGEAYTSLEDLVTESFKEAVYRYQELLDKNSDIVWSDYKATRIMHLAGIQAFSSDTLMTGGHDSSLNAQKSRHGPSWRMIVSLTDPIVAYGVYPGGQSGNPGSPFYMNMIQAWASGKYHRLYKPVDPDSLKNVITKWICENE